MSNTRRPTRLRYDEEEDEEEDEGVEEGGGNEEGGSNEDEEEEEEAEEEEDVEEEAKEDKEEGYDDEETEDEDEDEDEGGEEELGDAMDLSSIAIGLEETLSKLPPVTSTAPFCRSLLLIIFLQMCVSDSRDVYENTIIDGDERSER
jgi:hypothetical protein